MLKGIAALRAQGRVTWGQPIFQVDIRGDGALLRDCQDARRPVRRRGWRAAADHQAGHVPVRIVEV
jgi:hypothetical protein